MISGGIPIGGKRTGLTTRVFARAGTRSVISFCSCKTL